PLAAPRWTRLMGRLNATGNGGAYRPKHAESRIHTKTETENNVSILFATICQRAFILFYGAG
ncbi:MAG: hypothetical protein II970_08390, partial [Paludibacteraceae bacterium]|nr:hypothetical protein [Paludibacteraceae bacterium]